MIPFLLSALPLSTSLAAAPDIILSRGSELMGPFAGVHQKYWDVTEGEIDAQGPDLSIPTNYALSGSNQRKVLLRFGSIDIATLRQSKIVDATLVLTMAETDKASVKAVKVLKRPWFNPGVSILQRRIQGKEVKATNPKEVPFAAGVTWNKAGGDVSGWQSGGASGRDDTETVDEKIEVKNGEIRISNLGPTLQHWKTHEGENYGFLIEFTQESSVWSSKSPEGRPRLELKLENAAVTDPHFFATHDGDIMSLHASAPIKTVDVFRGTNKLGTETTSKINLTPGNNSKDPRGALMRVVANFEDPNIPQEVLTVDPGGQWVKQNPVGTRIWNSWNVDQSFYSFAKYGAMKYVNGEGETNETLLPEVQKLSTGARQMETMLLSGLVIPVRPTRNKFVRQMTMVDGGPLSMPQVDLLMNGKLQYPKVILARIVNIDDQPMEDVSVSVKTSESETHDIKAEKTGIFIMPKLPANAVGDVTITATLNGVTETLVTPISNFSDLFARGNRLAISIDLPFNFGPWPINTETNLIVGKPANDSAKSFPAQLAGLVDDNPDTEYVLPAKGWVEIDLGRDRLLGELDIQGEVPQRFNVKVYGTTDKVDQADVWIDEINAELFRSSYGQTGDTIYRPSPNTARYVRIENLTDKPAHLKGIKVFAAKKP